MSFPAFGVKFIDNQRLMSFFLIFAMLQYWVFPALSSTIVDPPICAEANVIWTRLMKEQPHNIHAAYLPDAITLAGNGRIITEKKDRLAYFQPLTNSRNGLKKIVPILCEWADQDVLYHLSQIELNQGPTYVQLVIWRKQNNLFYRELDFLAPLTPQRTDLVGLVNARNKWMAFCNDHNVEDLVGQLYAPDALYYNHKPLVIGQSSLIEVYAYMRSEDYTLKLEPIVMQPVNANMVVEIGHCSGSYNGKYILIWRKNENGQWTVWFDSNV